MNLFTQMVRDGKTKIKFGKWINRVCNQVYNFRAASQTELLRCVESIEMQF